jgi:hypothetical protein
MSVEDKIKEGQHLFLAADPSHEDIRFFVKDSEEIVRFCGNGDIYVKGNLTTNDIEVVEGIREFLGQVNLPNRNERKAFDKLSQAFGEATSLLAEWADNNNEPCSYDHHGYCQAHFLEFKDECIVKRTLNLVDGK